MTFNGMVKVNNVARKDENFPVQVFDVLNLERAKLNYRLEIVNKKFSLAEISDKEAEEKIVKISGKKVLGKDKLQMNLDDGQNILTKEKFSVGDSVVLNTKENRIVKVLALKEGAKVEIVLGKHAGEKGELVGFEELVRGRNYEIKLEDKTVRLPYKTVLVIG
jgi:ribosomal protein S4E